MKGLIFTGFAGPPQAAKKIAAAGGAAKKSSFVCLLLPVVTGIPPYSPRSSNAPGLNTQEPSGEMSSTRNKKRAVKLSVDFLNFELDASKVEISL